MYKLIFFVPLANAFDVKQAIFATGAGCLGNYEHCCFQSQGQGQFRPLPGAKPALGQLEQLTIVEELKVEILCQDNNIHAALNALKSSHPYEEVAYEVIKLEPF